MIWIKGLPLPSLDHDPIRALAVRSREVVDRRTGLCSICALVGEAIAGGAGVMGDESVAGE
jgi:hypothetical protein